MTLINKLSLLIAAICLLTCQAFAGPPPPKELPPIVVDQGPDGVVSIGGTASPSAIDSVGLQAQTSSGAYGSVTLGTNGQSGTITGGIGGVNASISTGVSGNSGTISGAVGGLTGSLSNGPTGTSGTVGASANGLTVSFSIGPTGPSVNAGYISGF